MTSEEGRGTSHRLTGTSRKHVPGLPFPSGDENANCKATEGRPPWVALETRAKAGVPFCLTFSAAPARFCLSFATASPQPRVVVARAFFTWMLASMASVRDAFWISTRMHSGGLAPRVRHASVQSALSFTPSSMPPFSPRSINLLLNFPTSNSNRRATSFLKNSLLVSLRLHRCLRLRNPLLISSLLCRHHLRRATWTPRSAHTTRMDIP